MNKGLVIIAGDSWACGEWKEYEVQHRGLAQFLEDDGHTVINIGRGGNSNWKAYQDLKILLSNPFFSKTKKVFLFQTEWIRDFCYMSDYDNHNKYYEFPKEINQTIIENHIYNWYHRLSELAQEHNVKIQLIGGASDTFWFEKFESEYPGLNVACQSLTNLILNNLDRVSTPVLSIKTPEKLLTLSKQQKQNLEYMLNSSDLGSKRNKQWKSNPQWFYPDGVHPNRQGHQKLFKYLKHKDLL